MLANDAAGIVERVFFYERLPSTRRLGERLIFQGGADSLMSRNERLGDTKESWPCAQKKTLYIRKRMLSLPKVSGDQSSKLLIYALTHMKMYMLLNLGSVNCRGSPESGKSTMLHERNFPFEPDDGSL